MAPAAAWEGDPLEGRASRVGSGYGPYTAPLPPLAPRSAREPVVVSFHPGLGLNPTAPPAARSKLAACAAANGKNWSQRPQKRAGELFRGRLQAGPSIRQKSSSPAPTGRASPPGQEGPEEHEAPPETLVHVPRQPTEPKQGRLASRLGSFLVRTYVGEKADAFCMGIEATDEAAPQEAAEAPVDPDGRRELAQLRTGEDAVKFFSRQGGNARVKILYCNRAPHDGAEEVGPYDLVIEPKKEKLLSEHFAISERGVVHYQPGELSEFTTLQAWLHETLMYKVLRAMRVFRFSAHIHMFAHWRSGAKQSVYGGRRQQLARRCLFAKPAFVGALVRVRHIVGESELAVRVLKLPSEGRTLDLDQFVLDQQKAQGNAFSGAQRELEARQEKLRHVLEELAVRVQRNLVEGAAPPSRGPGGSRPSSRPAAKSVSMAEEKQQARHLARRRQVVQEDKVLLGSCVQLADAIGQAALVSVLQCAADVLLLRVGGAPAAPPKKLWSVRACLQQDAVEMDPPAARFLGAVDHVWREGVKLVDAVPPLAGILALSQHTDGRGSPDVGEVILANRRFAETTSRLREVLGQQLGEAQKWASEAYAPCFAIRDHAERWTEAAYTARPHTLQELADQLELLRKFQKDLEKLRVQRVVGVVVLDGRAQRDALAGSLEEALSAMLHALLTLAQKRCAGGRKELAVAIGAVDERPHKQAVFDAYVKMLCATEGKQDAFKDAVDDVRQAHSLLRANGFRMPLEDQLQLDALAEKERDLDERAIPEARLFVAEWDLALEEQSEGVGGDRSQTSSPLDFGPANPAPDVAVPEREPASCEAGGITITVEPILESTVGLSLHPLMQQDAGSGSSDAEH